ncbi:MAG TPA: hypothetical protein VGX52_09890, partial [Burkholderiales bacterium]|nr:hypothetical protein [Burkholderiales bacterium]
RELAEARRALAAFAQRVQTVQVAADTRIHQSQVSRLLRGQFKRVSSNVRKLLAYAADPKGQAGAAEPAQTAKEAVVRAALSTWDATPEGARALVRLLKSVRAIREVQSGAPRRRRR